jgi:hypothetical protein
MADVAKCISGKILVGHALHNDLDVLMLSHPRSKIRDTATFVPYMRVESPPSLPSSSLLWSASWTQRREISSKSPQRSLEAISETKDPRRRA